MMKCINKYKLVIQLLFVKDFKNRYDSPQVVVDDTPYYTNEEVERLKIKVTDYIMSQSSSEINKFSRKFSKILY